MNNKASKHMEVVFSSIFDIMKEVVQELYYLYLCICSIMSLRYKVFSIIY